MSETIVGPGGVAFPASVVKQQEGPANRIGGCAGCGSCCTRLTLAHSPDGLAERKANLDAFDAAVAAGEKIPDGYAEAWEERRGDIEWGVQLVYLERNMHGQHVYACPLLDPESKLCTIHERRPKVCRDFPWYGRAPGDDTAEFPDGCSYQWELPLRLRGPLTGGEGVHAAQGPTGPVGRLIPLWPV